jgi:hypothetical protein
MAEIEFVIEPDGITNDIRWESVTPVSIHPEIILYRELTCQYHDAFVRVTTRQTDRTYAAAENRRVMPVKLA